VKKGANYGDLVVWVLTVCTDETRKGTDMAEQDKNMNWRAFAASLIGSVTWPIVILILLLNFREPIEKKIGQIADMQTPLGTFSFALMEQAMEDQAAIQEITDRGIQTEEDIRLLEKVATTSGRFSTLMGKSETGEDNKALQMTRGNFDTSLKMLKDIESMKNVEAETGVTASRVNEIKKEAELLRKLEIDPERINPERDAEKIAVAVRKDPRLKQSFARLSDPRYLEALKTDVKQLEKAEINPQLIPQYRIKPELLDKIKINTRQYEKYER
jgi:hypothetical protein